MNHEQDDLTPENSMVESTVQAMAVKSVPGIQRELIILIVGGTLIRFCFPFWHNPLDNLFSDFLRHFNNATSVNGIMYLIDQPGYEIWLGAVLRITGAEHTAVAIYAGILSAVTPWFWYQWMRECLPEKTDALAGYAILALLPDWIGTSAYFMQETILLPLLGCALWLTWRAVRRFDLISCLLASCVWGCTIATKASVVPIALLVWMWMVKRFAGSFSKTKAITFASLTMSILATFYLAGPLKFYYVTGFATLFPGDYTRVSYESGARLIKFEFKFKDRFKGDEHVQHCLFWSPSLFERPLQPLSDWMSSRKGVGIESIDYSKSGPPHLKLSLPRRVDFIIENFIFYLFGPSWPMDAPDRREIDYFACIERWLWFPATCAILAISLFRKPVTFLQILSLGSLAIVLLQQSYLLEGRYRMPWEGIVVACALLLATREPLNSLKEDKIPKSG